MEEVNKPTYTSFGSELILSDIKKSPVTNIEYPVLITKDGGTILHLSVSSNPNAKFIELEEVKALRDMLLPKDKIFGMFFPPEHEFINIHRNYFHLIENQKEKDQLLFLTGLFLFVFSYGLLILNIFCINYINGYFRQYKLSINRNTINHAF